MHALGLGLATLIGAVLIATTGAFAREPHWPGTESIGTASAGGAPTSSTAKGLPAS